MKIHELKQDAMNKALNIIRSDLLNDSNGFIYEDDFHLNMNCDYFMMMYCNDNEYEFTQDGQLI